jgi:hypothetical protein
MIKEIGEIPLLNVDHLPPGMFENIANPIEATSTIDIIRKLPFHVSVPIIMQIVLHASVAETAEYLKISKQTIYKKNKCLIKILSTCDK